MIFRIRLFCFFDSNSATKSLVFFSKVNKVVVVDCNFKLFSRHTCTKKLFFNACSTVFAKTSVDFVVTCVVISPTCNNIFCIGVIFHYFSTRFYDFNIFASKFRYVDWEIYSSKRSFFLNNFFFNRAF